MSHREVLLTPAGRGRPATGGTLRRYERARPGELLHVDVEKLGRVPGGGGHKILGRAAGSSNEDRRDGVGYAYLGTASALSPQGWGLGGGVAGRGIGGLRGHPCL